MYFADALGFLGLPGQPPKIEEGLRLNLVHLTAAPPWVREPTDLYREVKKFEEGLRPLNNRIRIIKNVSDTKLAGPILIVLGLQNSPKFEAKTKEQHIYQVVGVLGAAGIKIISPVYQGLNELGSGWENAGIGLTSMGRKFLGACEMNGLIVDLSHSGHQTARDIVNSNVKAPIVASHGGCYMKYHHSRNLPDDVLRSIADKGGVVGCYLLTFGLHDDRNDLFPAIEHLEHMVNVCGYEAVVIGSDSHYTNITEIEALKNFNFLKDRIDPLGLQGARYPEYVLTGPRLMEILAERLSNISSIKTNLSPRVIEKIMGLNLRSFLERSL